MASSSRTSGKAPSRSPESYDSLFKRNTAAEILQSYEKLSWYSFQRCESLTQTRLHFQNIVAGFTGDDEAALVDWKEDRTPRGEKTIERGKGKDRISLGGGEAAAGSSTRAVGKAREKSDGGGSGATSAKKKRKGGGN